MVRCITRILLIMRNIRRCRNLILIQLRFRIRLTTFLNFSNVGFPILRFSINSLLSNFRNFLFNTLNELRATLIFIMRKGNHCSNTSLFTRDANMNSNTNRFAIRCRLIRDSNLAIIIRRYRDSIRDIFIKVSNECSVRCRYRLQMRSCFDQVLFTTLCFRILMSLTFKYKLDDRASGNNVSTSTSLLNFSISCRCRCRIFKSVPLFMGFGRLTRTKVLRVFKRTSSKAKMEVSLGDFLRRRLILYASLIVL